MEKSRDSIEDITRIQELEGRLRAREYLAWIGLTAASWTHEINHYAAKIRLLVQLVEKNLVSDPDRARQDLSEIGETAARLAAFPDLPSFDAVPPKVSLHELITKYLKSRPWIAKEAHVRCHIDIPPEAKVGIEPDWFFQCMDILVDNSLKAMEGLSDRTLAITSTASVDSLLVVVRDTGSGISPEVRPKLFRSPIVKDDKQKGLGIGLLVASAIVDRVGGGIAARSNDDCGESFTLTLPRAQ